MTLALSLILAGGVTVALPLESRVRGTEMTLGEVASVRGEDPELVARVEAVSLGYAPAPGYSRLLRDYNIEAALRRVEPELELAFEGQAATRVWPEVERIGGDAIRAAAADALAVWIGTSDATAQLARPLGALEVPLGDAPATLRPRLEPRELEAGRINVPVEVAVDGTLYRTVWTSWRLDVYDTVPVLARRVAAGETLTPTLFEPRRVAVDGPGTARGLSQAMVIGAVATRDLAAGSVVTDLDVHRPKVVLARDGVFVQVRMGPITARVPAVAKEAGSIGERIRVIVGAGNELSGVVKSRDVVEVDLDPALR